MCVRKRCNCTSYCSFPSMACNARKLARSANKEAGAKGFPTPPSINASERPRRKKNVGSTRGARATSGSKRWNPLGPMIISHIWKMRLGLLWCSHSVGASLMTERGSKITMSLKAQELPLVFCLRPAPCWVGYFDTYTKPNAVFEQDAGAPGEREANHDCCSWTRLRRRESSRRCQNEEAARRNPDSRGLRILAPLKIPGSAVLNALVADFRPGPRRQGSG